MRKSLGASGRQQSNEQIDKAWADQANSLMREMHQESRQLSSWKAGDSFSSFNAPNAPDRDDLSK